MYTNDNGLSTIVSEGYDRYDEPETRARYNYETFLGNICITQVNDDGNEIWGTILPKSQCITSYKRFYHPIEFAKKNEEAFPFYDLPDQVYQNQFLSFNTYQHNRSFLYYI